VEDAPRPGRPSLYTLERTWEMIAEVCKDKEGRNINCCRLKGKLRVLKNTAYCMLKENRFRRVKKLVKPRLTKAMKKAWLEFCKAYEY
jgi:hypothetical protein